MPRKTVYPLLIVAAFAMALPGCGSGGGDSASNATTTAKREASGTGCPEKDGSKATVFPVANYLDEPVELRGYDVDCYDWSGSSTPDRVFGNVVLQPGEKKDFDLEAYADDALFSLGFTSTKTGSIGSIRLLVRPGRGTYVQPWPDPKDMTRTKGWRLMKLKPTEADPVPLDRLEVKRGFGITYYDGYVQAVTGD